MLRVRLAFAALMVSATPIMAWWNRCENSRDNFMVFRLEVCGHLTPEFSCGRSAQYAH